MSLAVGSLARATIRTSGILALRLLLVASTLILLTRLLDPADFGVFAGITALSVMAGSMATMGTHLVVMRNVAADTSSGARTMEYAAGATLVGAALMSIIYASAVAWVVPSGALPLFAIAALAIADVVLHPFLQLTSGRLLGTGSVARSQVLLILPLAFRLLAVIALLGFAPQAPLGLYCLFYAGASLAALAVCWMSGGTTLPSLRSWRLPSIPEWKDALGYACLNLTATAPGELDKALSARLLAADAAGIYSTASRITGAIVSPITALMLSALPRLFSMQVTRDRHLVPAVFAASLFYGITAAGALYLATPHLAGLFGPDYASLEFTLPLLAIAVPGMTLRLSGASTLMATGRPIARACIEGVGLSVMALVAILATTGLAPHAWPLIYAVTASEWSMAILAWLTIAGRCRRGQATTRQTTPD
ncbi:lipopolysaccharide biosynthesis protein [Luteimonas terrae]|nr:oligosaccharide flippase family protein [Luteimonas terrae]